MTTKYWLDTEFMERDEIARKHPTAFARKADL
jgi:hypothetical protein